MAGSTAFTWDMSTLNTNVKNLDRMLIRMITAAVEFHATRGEAYMKLNAKWKDRSTNARGSLSTTTTHSPESHTITFAHGMPYGIWLEVRWAGKYAIIMPAAQATGRDLMQTINGGMARIK